MPRQKWPAGAPGGRGGEWMPANGHISVNPAAKTLDLFRGWARSQVQRLTGKPDDPENLAPVARDKYFGGQGDFNAYMRGEIHRRRAIDDETFSRNTNHTLGTFVHDARAREDARYDSDVKAIDAEFMTSPFILAAEQRVYRGIAQEFAGQLRTGTEFTDQAYVSTTALRQQASRLRHSPQQPVVAVISLAAPTRTLIYSKEAEFLLPRGTRFKVLHNDGKTVHLEAHPPEAFRKWIP